jgi:predicted AAA+ superfamily ATPase
MKKKRILYENIWKMLSIHKQMVFIAGPRQAGKTTFTQILAEDFNNSLYFNWDILDEKRKLIENPFFYEEVHRKDKSMPLIIFDELHKYSNWKNYLKSVYDRDNGNYKFIVSGSGRLDMYQKGGDSLAGRYFMFYLWPFTLAELAGNNLPFEQFMSNPIEVRLCPNETQPAWNRLSRFSGFPDPYLSKTDQFYRIWSNTYRKQLLREDMKIFVILYCFATLKIWRYFFLCCLPGSAARCQWQALPEIFMYHLTASGNGLRFLRTFLWFSEYLRGAKRYLEL